MSAKKKATAKAKRNPVKRPPPATKKRSREGRKPVKPPPRKPPPRKSPPRKPPVKPPPRKPAKPPPRKPPPRKPPPRKPVKPPPRKPVKPPPRKPPPRKPPPRKPVKPPPRLTPKQLRLQRERELARIERARVHADMLVIATDLRVLSEALGHPSDVTDAFNRDGTSDVLLRMFEWPKNRQAIRDAWNDFAIGAEDVARSKVVRLPRSVRLRLRFGAKDVSATPKSYLRKLGRLPATTTQTAEYLPRSITSLLSETAQGMLEVFKLRRWRHTDIALWLRYDPEKTEEATLRRRQKRRPSTP